MTSFFGGDPNMAHYSCHLSILAYPIRSQERRDAYAKIKEAFPGRDKYFQYRVKIRGKVNHLGKMSAKRSAEKHSADILAKTGIKTEVSEGFFL